MWEILYRALKGEYARPYSDQKQMIADYQILIAVAKKGLRPTIPDNCPESFKMMLRSCWVDDPAGRPDCGFLLASLRTIKDREYKANKQGKPIFLFGALLTCSPSKEWDKALPITQAETATTTTEGESKGEKEKTKKTKKHKDKEGEEGKKKKKGSKKGADGEKPAGKKKKKKSGEHEKSGKEKKGSEKKKKKTEA